VWASAAPTGPRLLGAAGLLILLGAFALHYALATLLGGVARPMDDGAWPEPVVLADPALPGRSPAEPALALGAWCYGLLALPGIVGLALLPGPQPGGFFELGPIPNPLGWEPAGEVLRPVNAIAQVVATALLGVAVVSMVLRLRRASGVGLVVVPAAIGVAVLRYRLYDIDRLINRTLVYGLLTLLLGGGYAAVVLVLGQLAGQDSSLAVAGATLAVAALFQPARRRIQQVVDRRFNRRRYDAAKTIEAFSARLRDEVDLDTLTGELLAVATQTVEPTKASLWLRDSGGRS
jgi:hypothetical protein